jgi:hypothetical protein
VFPQRRTVANTQPDIRQSFVIGLFTPSSRRPTTTPSIGGQPSLRGCPARVRRSPPPHVFRGAGDKGTASHRHTLFLDINCLCGWRRRGGSRAFRTRGEKADGVVVDGVGVLLVPRPALRWRHNILPDETTVSLQFCRVHRATN